MNYSKESRDKIEKKNKGNGKQVKKKGKITAFRVIIITLIITVFAAVGAGLGIFIGIIKSAPDPSTIDISPQGNYTSFVYDAAGNRMDSFEPAENREYVELKDIPDYLQKAVIVTEDERFYEHNGIDIRGIFRALVENFKTGEATQGASTITQQLVKNTTGEKDKTIKRKIQEQYLAVKFEELYSKDTILEYYLNTMALGRGVMGVRTASKRYFGKDVQDLSIAESAVIAGITQNPSLYDPISKPENNWDKATTILNKLNEQGYITTAEYEAALKENPYENILAVHQEFLDKEPHSYFVDALFNQLVEDLEALGHTEEAAKKMIYGGGLEIYSTLDKNMQRIADTHIQDESLYPSHLYKIQLDYSVSGTDSNGEKFQHQVYNVILDSEDDIEAFKQKQLQEWGVTEEDEYIEGLIKQPQPQASFVLMDYRTGQVKALSGGRGEKSNLSFNYATQAKRQPGSTFKVLAAYAPAIDLGLLSPGSVISNDKVSYPRTNNEPYVPENWDKKYGGSFTVREAIANSMNVIAVKTTVDIVGIEEAFDYLNSFGFTTLQESDKGYSLSLGGLTEGVTPLELNAAYGAIANDGVYVKPIFYTKVKDREGRVLIDNTNEAVVSNSRAVIKQSTARMLTDMMTTVVDGPGPHTGSRVRSYFKNMPIAGKTGTTTKDKDLVFAGYTPYYVGTIWTGYSIPKPLNSANNYHLVLWSKIMNDIHENLEYKSFPEVEMTNTGVSEMKICTLSGKLATALCEKDHEHGVKYEFFTSGQRPTEYCDLHVEVEICSESGKIANEFCPKELVKKEFRVRNSSDAPIAEGEMCDIHGPDTLEPSPSPGIDDPDLDNEGNGDDIIEPVPTPDTSIPGIEPTPNPDVNEPDIEPTPTPDINEPDIPDIPDPELPLTTDDPNISPDIDDEDNFFLPQE